VASVRGARHQIELLGPWLMLGAILLLAFVVGRLPGG
jgi:hypothetical protein